jgi:hypothetical protein
LDRPQLDFKYLAKNCSFFNAAIMDVSMVFWSESLVPERGSLDLGLPSSKNSSSAEDFDLVVPLAK